MTADPGAYDLADLRSRADEQRGDQSRDDAPFLRRGEYTETLARRAGQHALAMTERAVGLSAVELTEWRPVFEALVLLDDACDEGLSRFDPEFEALLGGVFDALHRARGTWQVTT